MRGQSIGARVVGSIGELMITCGVIILLFAAWQLWWTDVTSGAEFDAGRQELRQQWQQPVSAGDNATPAPAAIQQRAEVAALHTEPPPENLQIATTTDGELFALLHVPRFGADWGSKPIVGGTNATVLAKGVGYYEDTAPVGGVGNFAIAGHRTTYGRPFHNIDQLQPGDPIVVETRDAWFVYTFTVNQIVLPTQVDVIAPVPNQPEATPTERIITLTACHPKFSAEERFIAHGVLKGWLPKSEGTPAEVAGLVKAEI